MVVKQVPHTKSHALTSRGDTCRQLLRHCRISCRDASLRMLHFDEHPIEIPEKSAIVISASALRAFTRQYRIARCRKNYSVLLRTAAPHPHKASSQ